MPLVLWDSLCGFTIVGLTCLAGPSAGNELIFQETFTQFIRCPLVAGSSDADVWSRVAAGGCGGISYEGLLRSPRRSVSGQSLACARLALYWFQNVIDIHI